MTRGWIEQKDPRGGPSWFKRVKIDPKDDVGLHEEQRSPLLGGERSWGEEECDAGIESEDTVTEEERTEEGLRRFVCPICKEGRRANTKKRKKRSRPLRDSGEYIQLFFVGKEAMRTLYSTVRVDGTDAKDFFLKKESTCPVYHGEVVDKDGKVVFRGEDFELECKGHQHMKVLNWISDRGELSGSCGFVFE